MDSTPKFCACYTNCPAVRIAKLIGPFSLPLQGSRKREVDTASLPCSGERQKRNGIAQPGYTVFLPFLLCGGLCRLRRCVYSGGASRISQYFWPGILLLLSPAPSHLPLSARPKEKEKRSANSSAPFIGFYLAALTLIHRSERVFFSVGLSTNTSSFS